MLRKTLVAAVLAAALPSYVSAGEIALSSAEISKLFTGNSAQGLHHEKHTRQYFSKSGLTLWTQQGDVQPSEGRWKAENDSYCSTWTGLWNEENWSCYAIMHDEEQGLYYFTGENFRVPFIVKEGHSLSFE